MAITIADLIGNAANTTLVKNLQDAFSQYGYNRQQGTPVGGGGGQAGTSTIGALTGAGWGPSQVAATGGQSTVNQSYATPEDLARYQTTNPQDQNQKQAPSGVDLKDRNSNPGEGFFWDAADGWKSVMESAPAAPSIDYNAIFAPAFEALNQQQGATQGFYDAGLLEAETGTAQRKQGLQSEQESRLADFGQQRTEATQTTESAIEQARRQASELLQGLQARYGGTTGTGQFSSEILGSQATRNIAQNQQALQNTLGKIGQAENDLKTKVTELINNEDQNLESQKTRLRAELQQSLADIASERGRLETEKAQMRIDALNQYQQVVQQVNARNAQFKQQLFLEQQSAASELEKLRQQAQISYKTNTETFDTGAFKDLYQAGVDTNALQSIPFGTKLDDKSLQDFLNPVGIASSQKNESIEDILGIGKYGF